MKKILLCVIGAVIIPGILIMTGFGFYPSPVQKNLLQGNHPEPGYQYRIIIKFKDHIQGRISQDYLFYSEAGNILGLHQKNELKKINSLKNSFHLEFSPVISLSVEKIKAFQKRMEGETGISEPDIAGLMYIDVNDPWNTGKIEYVLNELKDMDILEYARVREMNQELRPAGDVSPDYEPTQFYKDPDPGMNVDFAWTQGATGLGVRITDIEWGWLLSHEDLAGSNIQVQYGQSFDTSEGKLRHGTMVVGIYAAGLNGYGIEGIAPDAEYWVYPLHNQDPLACIYTAIIESDPGDVILLEVEHNGKPWESDPDIKDAIEYGVSNNIIMIEPAGNEPHNLDDPAYYDLYYENGVDSGAIIVGGGNSDIYHGHWVGCYGSRVDIQNWSTTVFSTDCPFDPVTHIPDDQGYGFFEGTSAAGALTAGACAILQSAAEQYMGRRLTASEMRTLLKTSGKRQEEGYPIGRFVDLQHAIISIQNQPPGGGTYNYPPIVDTGNDRIVYLPDTGTTLSATVTNEPGEPYTTTWNQLAGPGAVNFGDVNDPNTTVMFPAAGKYVLALSANDSVNEPNSCKDMITVYVTHLCTEGSWTPNLIGGDFSFEDMTVEGDYACILENDAGLKMVNISNPASPQYAGIWNGSYNLYDVEVEGNYAYIADDQDLGTLFIVNIQNPSSPQTAGTYHPVDNLRQGFAVDNGIAYIAQGPGGIKFVDVLTNPGIPALLSTYSISGQNLGFLQKSGDYLYLNDRTRGFIILYVSDIYNPVEKGLVNYPGKTFLDVKVAGNYAYIIIQGEGVKIIDITPPANPADPVNPVEVGSYATEAGELAYCDGYLYLLHNREIEIVDVSIPSQPVLNSYYSPVDQRVNNYPMFCDKIVAPRGGDTLFLLGKYEDKITTLFSDRLVILSAGGTSPPQPYIEAAFDSDAEGFTFAPDTFDTYKPYQAEGIYTGTGGYSGGGLRVYLKAGSWFNPSITSGGWSNTFYLDAPETVMVSLHYRMVMGQGYETDEYGEVLLSVDGTKYGNDLYTSIKHVYGNGNGGGEDDTGWLYEEIDIPLGAGYHTITIGGYNKQSTDYDEYVYIYLDDITVSPGN